MLWVPLKTRERKSTKEPKNEAAKGPTQKKQNQGDNCFVCSKLGHVKKKRTKYLLLNIYVII